MSLIRRPFSAFRKLKRRYKIGVVTTGVVLAVAGSAFAFYLTTLTGSGSGSGTLGGSPSAVNIALSVQGISNGNLTPGSSEPITIRTDNSVNLPDGSYTLPGLTVGAVTIDNTHQTAGCDPSWFTVDSVQGENNSDQPDPFPQSRTAAPSATGLNGGEDLASAVLHFTDSGTDQSACEGATITVPASIP